MLIFLWQNIMDWYQWWEEPVHWSQHAHTRPKSVYIFILLTVLLSPVFVSFCRNMQLSPTHPLFCCCKIYRRVMILLKIQTLWIWGWFFFQWCDKYHLTVSFILKFQVPFRWKNVHMHRFFGIGYIYSQFKLLTSPQAPPDYRVWCSPFVRWMLHFNLRF